MEAANGKWKIVKKSKGLSNHGQSRNYNHPKNE